MEKEIYIKKGWLFIPVCATYGELPFGGKKNNRMLEIFCRENNSETKLFEFQIPAGEAEDETYPVSYYARFPVKQFTDKTLILRGDLRKAFFDGIRNEDVPETEEKSLRATQGEAFRRPAITVLNPTTVCKPLAGLWTRPTIRKCTPRRWLSAPRWRTSTARSTWTARQISRGIRCLFRMWWCCIRTAKIPPTTVTV